MQYPILNKLYYKNHDQYIIEKEYRKNSIAASVLTINIHKNIAFYMNCAPLTELIAAVYRNLIKINRLIGQTPPGALNSYINSCLIDEIMLTNDIEGVYSTRKEIKEILGTSDRNDKTKVRLEGLVKKYNLLCSDDKFHIDLSSVEDLRTLYDEIVATEIPECDLPDGRVFRKGSVSVVSVTDKEKHRGIAPPETNIINAMSDALGILNNDSVPKIISIAVFHYFLGYVHPFYDGNGRLSRFISSYFIKNELDLLVALRLSYAIKNNRKAYYDAFDIVNDAKNFGDITPFVLMFLEMLVESENSIIEKLEHGIERLKFYLQLLDKLDEKYHKVQVDMIFILVQNKLFGSDDLDITELASELELNEGTTRKYFDELLKTPMKDVVYKRRQGHKYCYYIDLDKLENVCRLGEDSLAASDNPS